MSIYYSSLVSHQELEWWLVHDPAVFPLVPHVNSSGVQQDAFYNHTAITPPLSSSYPSPDHTPPMQFASVPTWATDVATPAEPPSLVTPAHGHTKTSSKNKNCEGSPNKKRYPCSYCAKDFTRDADRKRHEGCVHFGIREFHCPYVGCLSKGFVRNYDLGRHMKSCRFRQ